MILTWRKDRRTIKFVDTLNIWRVPLKEIGDNINLPKLHMPDNDSSQARWDAYCRRDVKVIMLACMSWFQFLIDNDLGGFQCTLASQSFAAYRHRFMPRQIFIDDNDQAIDLSRQAYLGGRTECFKLGEYTDDLYLVDVNSMYPSVMYTNQFPHTLNSVYSRVTTKDLSDWLETDSLVASVTIHTDKPIVPIVHDDKLVFPVGTFTCSLTTPELRLCLENDCIKHVHKIASYQQDYLFRDFVDAIYNLRLQAKAAGDTLYAWLYKILLNSLYGKFGQRGRRYIDSGPYDIDCIDTWLEYDIDSGTMEKVRAFGGLLQRWVDDGESFHSHPAIAAHVTAYARVILYNAIQTAGPDNCYYCDTDSLLVNYAGYSRLSGMLDNSKLGAWSLDRHVNYAHLRGPKDYILGDNEKIKGVRKTAYHPWGDTYLQDHFVGLRGLLQLGTLDGPIVYPDAKTMSRQYTKGTPQPDGTISPLSLNIE